MGTLKKGFTTTTKFEGVFRDTYRELPILSQLFTVLTEDEKTEHEFFVPNMKDLVKTIEETEGCNSYPAHCVDGNTFIVTSDETIYMNEEIPQCINGTLSRNLLTTYVAGGAEEFIAKRLEKGFAKHNEVFAKKEYTGNGLGDLNDDIAELSEIVSEKQLVIVMTPQFRKEIKGADFDCCNYMIQNQKAGQAIMETYMLNGIYSAPTAILSSGLDEDVAYQIYAIDKTFSVEGCSVAPHIVTLDDSQSREIIGNVDMIKGKTRIGHDVLLNQADFGIVRTFGTSAPTKVAKAKK